MKKTDNSVGTKRVNRGNRPTWVISLAVLAALILAAIFIPLGIVRSRGEVMVSYGSVTVRRDLYVYWLSAYKFAYLSAAKRQDSTAADTPAFWNGATESGRTRAEDVRADADAWIRRIVFAASLFEEDDSVLGAKTLDSLEDVYRRLLQYDLNTEKKFNRAAREIGFTYATVRRALFYENEYYAYVSDFADDADQFSYFCTLANSQVTLRAAAEKIDFVSLKTDERLYAKTN